MANCVFCEAELEKKITTDSVDDFSKHDTVTHYECLECDADIVVYFSNANQNNKNKSC